MQMADKNDLAQAVSAAKAAGELLMKHWDKRLALTVSSKRAGDFVSEADVSSELLLKELLIAEGSADGWLGEDGGGGIGTFSRRWIVDPLDGTTNFLRGIPHWAVSIALEQNGELVLGVVHDPVKSETFAALKGHGATLNGEAIGVSVTQDLTGALFGTGLPFGTMDHIKDAAHDIAALMPMCAGVRRMGAAALDLAYVASGRLDGFWERKLKLWDIAAGLVLLREAGARVEGWGDELPEASGTVLCATPGLFGAFAQTLRGK
jgi:myo-inositol-1(or 4)-monophosphatase